MMRRVLASRHFVAAISGDGHGNVSVLWRPFPENQLFLRVIAMRAPQVFLSFRWLYNVALFTTPYIAYLGVLSAAYIGTLRFRSSRRGRTPPDVSGTRTNGTICLLSWERCTTRRRPGPIRDPEMAHDS